MDCRDLARFFLPWLFLSGVALGAGCAGETTEGGTGGRGGVPGGSGGAGSGGRASGGSTAVDAGSPTACGVEADCAWGEIDHELLGPADCPCLYGCPYLALNRTTVERRRQQYEQLCNPNVDGQGHACGIDDCVVPPPLLCVLGQCVEAE